MDMQGISSGYHNILQKRFNKAQLASLLGCCEPNKVSLLQGPPGTGKSHTILGMAGLFLHAGEYIPTAAQQTIIFTRQTDIVFPMV